MRLEGRRVLITGAASGIGRATAELFLAEGAVVALLDCDEARLAQLVDGLAGDRAHGVQADVADPAAVAVAVEAACSRLGGLDGVVNAAGVATAGPIEATTLAEWQATLAVNLTGPFLVCRAALPALKAAGAATIVNIASGAGLRPIPEMGAYSAAKAGLVMFGKSLAMEVAADSIRVNAICPGIVDTPMFRRVYEGAADPQAELAAIKSRYLIERVAQPAEIAAAALFLTSDQSSYMTGAALAVDGGRTLH